MYGMIKPCLSKEEKEDYRHYYCGLCVGMVRCTGWASGFLTNFDVCLAYIIADSVNSDDETQKGICPFMPMRKISYRDNTKLVNRMAEINYLLFYNKVQDDIEDEGKKTSRIIRMIMKKRYEHIILKHESASEVIVEKMAALHDMEKNNRYIAVSKAAEHFGELMAGIMINCLDDKDDDYAFSLLCKNLGMWVYTVDACADICEDMRKGRYNPLLAGMNGDAQTIIKYRKEEIMTFLSELKNKMIQLLTLLTIAKNEKMLNAVFESLMSQQVSKMLK